MMGHHKGLRLWLLAGSSMLALTLGNPAFAQVDTDGADPDEEVVSPELEELEEVRDEDAEEEEEIVITGSRIRRSEFTSASPVQIISGEVSRDVGLFDATDILQESTATTGLQIDETFVGFVLDNGPGAAGVDLRGLGANRTLFLLNSRRLGPAGVGGAPNAFDTNLVPTALIDRIEVLQDGASSIYGSDAVAGVVNTILRTDFDGFEVEGNLTVPEESGGEQYTLSATYGATIDRGFFGIGVEYQRQDRIQLADRDHFGQCRSPYEETTSGEIRTENVALREQALVELGGSSRLFCNASFGINRIGIAPTQAPIDPATGQPIGPPEFGQFQSLYYSEGFTNVGIPNFTELALFGIGVDADGDGNYDVDPLDPFYQSALNPESRQQDVQPLQQTISAYSYGEYNLGGPADVDFFFEAGFFNRQTEIADEPRFSVFGSVVPGDNPFNPCNTDVTGVDCGEAFNQQIFNLFGQPLEAFGLQPAYPGPRPVSSQIRFRTQGDDNLQNVEVTYLRFVGGFKGDIPIPENIPLNNWRWEVTASYDRSLGQDSFTGINNDRLALSLATTIEDPNNPGSFICGLDVDGDGVPDPGQPFPPGGVNTGPDCVPVNLFAPSLYQEGGGNLATQEEYDYLTSVRSFDTVIEQSIIQLFLDGDIVELPYGTMKGVVGFEYRQDSIDSSPDDVAGTGELLGFFSDLGASGTRDLYEIYGETSIPVLGGLPFAEELLVEGSVRFTEESNFGSGTTFKVTTLYRPVDYLSLRGTYGTSFRAPDLREQFLIGTSGFLGPFDPCVVPESALTEFNQYDPAGDTREETVLENCRQAGVDPTTLGAGQAQPSTEVFTVSGSDLQEETSRSYTAGFVVEQPVFDEFDLQLAVTYYDIEVEDTLVELTRGFIVSQCFQVLPNQTSPLCPLIERGPLGFIDSVNTPFVNQDEETAAGIDINLLYEQDFTVFDNLLTVGADIDANRALDRTTTQRAPGSEPVEIDNLGTLYDEKWRGVLRAFADYRDFRVTWNTNWIGAADENLDPDAFGNNDTCLGIANGGVDCRDIGLTDHYVEHGLSVRYLADSWTAIVGVRNLLDTNPDQLDGDEAFLIGGTNIPFNQDINGRRFFINLSKEF